MNRREILNGLVTTVIVTSLPVPSFATGFDKTSFTDDISRIMKQYVFEINDKETRESVETCIDNYLKNVNIPYDSLVVCRDHNNLDLKNLVVDVYIKSSKDQEFVHYNFRLDRR